MADAKIETVTKTVPKEVEEKVYTVTLSEEEAKTVVSILGMVNGSPLSTYRQYSRPVYYALSNAGALDVYRERFEVRGASIYAKTITN